MRPTALLRLGAQPYPASRFADRQLFHGFSLRGHYRRLYGCQGDRNGRVGQHKCWHLGLRPKNRQQLPGSLGRKRNFRWISSQWDAARHRNAKQLLLQAVDLGPSKHHLQRGDLQLHSHLRSALREKPLRSQECELHIARGNFLQNNWEGDSQEGEAFPVTPVTQFGGCPNCQTTNLIYRYNYVTTVAEGYQIANIDGSVDGVFAYAGNNYSFHDQIFDDMTDPATCGPYSPSTCVANNNLLGLGAWTRVTYTGSTLLANHITFNHDTFVVVAPSAAYPIDRMNLIGPTGAVQNLETIENSIFVAGSFGVEGAGQANTCTASQSIANLTNWFNSCWVRGPSPKTP